MSPPNTVINEGMALADRYRLVSKLGSGGMADVFRARDELLERDVAVKVVRKAPEADLTRFRREMQTLSKLAHPSVVRLYDAGTHEGVPFLVMELVDGPSLAQLVADGQLPSELVSRVGHCVAEGLDHAHEMGIVHRDVKPGNVLLDSQERVYLTDFGIARLVDSAALTATGVTLGTAGYVAPEQLMGGEVNGAADVYALGLVLLQCLTGRKEFAGKGMKAAMARLERDPAVPDDLGGDWPELLRAMTARDPDNRPSAREVVKHLDVIQGTLAPTSATAREDPPPPARADETVVLNKPQPPQPDPEPPQRRLPFWRRRGG